MIDERVVLITGASRGLGHAMAELLAEDGWTVFGTSRNPADYSPEGWEMIELDVTDDASVRACVDEVMERAVRIDVLVNNAGFGLYTFAEEATIDEVRAQFDTNYLGVHRMNRAVLPIMREQQSGWIINISSLSGLIGTPPSAHYSATKHALEGYSQAMRFELAQFGIHVVMIEPGLTESDFRESLVGPSEPLEAYDDLRQHIDSMGPRTEERAVPAIAVARTLRRVLRSRRPRFRYTCTRMDWLAAHMLCWIPEGATHWVVRKVFRL